MWKGKDLGMGQVEHEMTGVRERALFQIVSGQSFGGSLSHISDHPIAWRERTVFTERTGKIAPTFAHISSGILLQASRFSSLPTQYTFSTSYLVEEPWFCWVCPYTQENIFTSFDLLAARGSQPLDLVLSAQMCVEASYRGQTQLTSIFLAFKFAISPFPSQNIEVMAGGGAALLCQ